MKMKLMLILMLTVLTIGCLFATSPFMWEEGGVAVRQGVNIEWSRASAVLPNGSVVYVWSDTRYGGRDLWAQAVDETGLLWGESGVLVDGKDDRQEDPVVITTSDGNAIIAWIDFYHDPIYGGVYAQKISPTGELLWDDSVPLCLADGEQISLNIVPDNDGGAFIIWQDRRDGTISIYGVHIDSDGENYTGWPEDGLALATGAGDQHSHTFWEDGQGGAILAYVNELGGGVFDIHVKRILSDGEIAWSHVLAEGAQEQKNVRMSPFGANAFGFAYTDRITDQRSIHVKAIDIDGSFLWADPVILYPSNYNQQNPRVTASTDGNFIVVWEDFRNLPDQEISDLYAQKVDINGNLLWGQEGVAVVVNPYNQRNPRIEEDASGGCYIIWDDAREGGFPEVDVYMQHISADGTISWEENGRAVAQIPGEAFAPLIKPAGDYIFASWGDGRTGSVGIYCQAFNLAGVPQFPANGIQIYWGLSGDADHESHRVVKSGDYVYITWIDTRYAYFGDQIKVQKVDLDGNFHFEENGISITPEHTGFIQDNMDVIPHHEGGLVYVWTEQPSDFVLVYTQSIDENGLPRWNNGEPVRVSTLDYWYQQDRPKVSYAGEGAYVIGWDETDYSEWVLNRDLRAQKIVNGERMWDDEGIVVGYQITPYLQDHNLEAVIGSYFVWIFGDGEYIYAKKLNDDGTVADGWDDYGNLISEGENTRGLSKSVLTPEGLLIVWEDKREWTSSIYGQLINENGVIQWEENGLALVDYENDQSMISLDYEDGYFYLTWLDARINPGLQDVGMQKFDLQGNPQWGVPAPYVSSGPVEQNNPNMVKVGDNLVAAWENVASEIGADIFLQLVNANTGQVKLYDEGMVMCAADKRQFRAILAPFNDSYALALWADGRSSGKEDIIGLYAQSINTNYVNIDSEPTVKPVIHLTLRANYPNPFNPETSISFDLTRNDTVSLSVYNVRGQLVKTLIDNETLEKGNHLRVWNGTDNQERTVGSGVYFYRLQGEKASQTRKMLLLK